MKNPTLSRYRWWTTLVTLIPVVALAQSTGPVVIADDFDSTTTSLSWISVGGACLTAASYGSNANSPVPGCLGGNPYYNYGSMTGLSAPDANFSGALRLTDGAPRGYGQAGAIISNFTFPSSQGMTVTFKTYTYGGDRGGSIGDGADGIAFLLMDGSYNPANYATVFDVGAWGGSHGYQCSNVNNDGHQRTGGTYTRRGYDGINFGYLGLGIDEYGDFINPGDNTATGAGFKPGSIGLRGAGSISWPYLTTTYGTYAGANAPYYPASLYTQKNGSGTYLSDVAVQQACRTGYLWNYLNPGAPVETTVPAPDYPAFPNYSVLNNVSIANESATSRTNALPISYNLTITGTNLLSLSYSVNNGKWVSIYANQPIVAANGTVPANFRFAFTGATGGSTNVHEVQCFSVAPSDTSGSSAGINQVETAKLQVGTQAYFAYYNPNNYAGYLTATGLSIQPNNTVTINPAATWNAACVLTGVAAGSTCLNTGVAGPTPPQANRTILTWSGTGGTAFEWNSLSTSQKAALGTQTELNFLRGDQSQEITLNANGIYRDRVSVLGDIVNSSPTWIGPPQLPYAGPWTDKLYASNPSLTPPETGYSTFASNYATRQNVVYIGANDGMVHGFRAGGYTTNGTFVQTGATPNDGQEVLAYVPGGVVNTLHTATAGSDFSNPNYNGAYYVDATPGAGDLYYNGAWHTWLVGGLGAGGAEIYALDVTNPTPANFVESNAGGLVIGDWTATAASLSCQGNPTCYLNLGNTWGTPQIRRFHNGEWGIVFGNGLQSSTGAAGIFILLFNTAGAFDRAYYLQASAGPGNGIAFVSPADFDGDHITDYVYAGDLKGNVWRFDVTSSSPASWSAGAVPLFTTPGNLPITTKVLVGSVPSSRTASRILVAFGTGQQTPATQTGPASYASGTQYLFGIWDWNMSGWNALSSQQYASVAGPVTVQASNLVTQTITGLADGVTVGTDGNGSTLSNVQARTVTNKGICWGDLASCHSNPQYGWQLALPGSQEQVIFSPALISGDFVVNTFVPAVITGCSPPKPTGFLMSIALANGGLTQKSSFTNAQHDGLYVDGSQVAGVGVSGAGTPTLFNGNTLITQTIGDTPVSVYYNPDNTVVGQRLTWIQKR